MAAPTINHNLTTFNDASTDPGSGWGQNNAKWDTDSEIYKEGGSSLGLAPNATGDGGNGWTGTSFDATARLILVWIFITDIVFVTSKATHGVYIRLAVGSDWVTDYYDYDVGGNDVAWVGKGWHCVVLDANRTPDRVGGSVDLTAVTRVGVGVNVATTSSKSNVILIDAIRHGTSFEVTGSISTTGVNLAFTESGSVITRASGDFSTDGYASGDIIYVRGSTNNDGRYVVDTVGTTTMTVEEALTDESSASGRTIDAAVAWADVLAWDIGTSTYNYGVVIQNQIGIYEINFPITLGDVSGSGRLAFESVGEVVYFADQPIDLASSDLYVLLAEDTGVTRVFFGESVGTGDDRVGFNGPTYSTDVPIWASDPYLDFDAGITELGIFGATLLKLTGASFFPDVSGGDHYITTTAFTGCGQIDVGSAECRGLTFAGYAGAADGALLWNDDIDIKNSRFLANTRAVEHPDYSGSPYTYTNLTFAGNTYDVNNSSGEGISIGKSGTSNPTTYTGDSVSFAASYPITILVQDPDRNELPLVQTSCYLLLSPYTELMNEDTDSDGIADAEYGGSTPVDIVVRARKSETTDSPRYTPHSSIQTITTAGLSLTITLEPSPIV